ncbi:MAG: DMT family transporter [Thaumarchaeota archaeon]|nr:DMT family transporter [Nitrososphaerota archaeon]
MGIPGGIDKIRSDHTGLFSSTKLGYIAVIIAATLEAFRQILSKAFLVPDTLDISNLNPITISFVIFIVNGIFFTTLARKNHSILQIKKKDLILLIFIGIAEGSALITYFYGLHDSTAINASVLNNGEILFSLLIAIIVFRERLQKMERLPFSMITVGMIALPVGYDIYSNGLMMTKLVLGDILLLTAGLFWALDINMSKYVSERIGSQRITQLASFMAAGFALGLILALQIKLDINPLQIPPIAIIGVVSIGLSTALFVTGLKLIGAVRTILIYSINSAFGVVFSVIFLHETISITNVISVSTAFVGLYLLRNRLVGIKQSATHEIKEHD